MNILVRLGVTAVAGVGAGVAAALIVTVIDLYLTGHGYGSITREYIAWAPAGIYLSMGDLAMLAAVIAVSVLTWFSIDR